VRIGGGRNEAIAARQGGEAEGNVDRPVGTSRRALIPSGAIVLSLLGACASEIHRPVRPEYDLRDPSATRRLTAISTVERTGDRSFVPALIELLDDDDETVRMAAGSTLKTLTGHDTGYRAFASPEERQSHVARWRAWWRAPTVDAKPAIVGAKDASSPVGAGYTSGGSHVRAP